jgi:pimeloyl-[acyl-carrier protein] methyl ester esterase
MALYTQTSGAGPDLMMVHGWGLHGGIWKPLLPLLEAHFRVTSVDLPGHGRSGWQGEETLDAMAGALLSVAPAGAAWLGWSLGGLVAVRAALLAPTRVNALIEIASSPCFVRRPGWQGPPVRAPGSWPGLGFGSSCLGGGGSGVWVGRKAGESFITALLVHRCVN